MSKYDLFLLENEEQARALFENEEARKSIPYDYMLFNVFDPSTISRFQPVENDSDTFSIILDQHVDKQPPEYVGVVDNFVRNLFLLVFLLLICFQWSQKSNKRPQVFKNLSP